MSTSNAHKQSLADVGSETRASMLKRGSYIPWVSHFRRYLNRKRETRKWLNKAIDDSPYEFKVFTPSETKAPRLQKEEDLRGDDLKHYDAEIEAMNLILISILNDIYNFVNTCTTIKAMWQRVEHLMRGTVQNQVDRETRFNIEFDEFIAKPGEALVFVYNRFAQLMNDLERNHIKFPLSLLTQMDSYDDLFDYLQQFEKLVNASRAKKLEKTHDPLALVAYTGSLSRTMTPYYVTHPSSVSGSSGNDGRNTRRSYVQEEVIEGTNVQNDVGNIQRTLLTTSSGTVANVQCYNCSEKGHYARNYSKPRIKDSKYFIEQMLLAKHDEARVILTDEQNDFLFADASRMEEIEELSANICLMAIIQPANIDSDDGPSYDFAFLSEIQMNIRDTEDIFEDATKSQIKMKDKIKDPIAIQKKQNVCTIDYNKLNALYDDFVTQKELSDEQKYFPSSFISPEDPLNESSPYSSSKTQPTKKQMPSANLILNVKQKPYAYADVRAQNQDLLLTISELKAKLKTVENGKSVNTKFYKENVSNKLLSVTPTNKQVFQKKHVVPKTEEKHVLSKIFTLQTSPNKQQAEWTNKNVIALGMYKVGTSQATNTNKAKSVLSSTRLSATSSVRRPSNRDSSFKNSVTSNTKNFSEKVEVSDRTNKKQDVASTNVALNTIITNDEIKNALIAKNVLCVTYAKNVLIPCHDNCLAKYKLNVRSKVRRALFRTHRTVKSTFKDTTLVVSKTRFSIRTVQSKSLDTTHPVVQIFLWIVYSGCSKHMTGDRSLLKNIIEKFMGTVCFENDHFVAIIGYGDYVQGNITICHVFYVEGLGHNLFSVGKFYDGDLEVTFHSKTCYVRNLEGDNLLTGDRESNLYTISILDMAASSPICLMSKASLTKSR
ncbi:hypothetical protein Tco_0581788 [Tanacetum coccineum]